MPHPAAPCRARSSFHLKIQNKRRWKIWKIWNWKSWKNWILFDLFVWCVYVFEGFYQVAMGFTIINHPLGKIFYVSQSLQQEKTESWTHMKELNVKEVKHSCAPPAALHNLGRVTSGYLGEEDTFTREL